ncbi:MAG: YidB family protein [Sedimenticola sp.]|nr:YidB family protein [Sedimenticola sp.]
MDLIKLGTELLMKKLGGSVDSNSMNTALSGLLGGSDGNINLSGLIGQFAQSGDLMGLANSWLGDGNNQSISADQIMSVLGTDKIGNFAAQLGISQSDAADSLADTLPQMIDAGSSGGNLLDMAGGAGDLLGMAKKFF